MAFKDVTIYTLLRNHGIILMTSQLAEKFQSCGKIIPGSWFGAPFVISLTSKNKKKKKIARYMEGGIILFIALLLLCNANVF